MATMVVTRAHTEGKSGLPECRDMLCKVVACEAQRAEEAAVASVRLIKPVQPAAGLTVPLRYILSSLYTVICDTLSFAIQCWHLKLSSRCRLCGTNVPIQYIWHPVTVPPWWVHRRGRYKKLILYTVYCIL
jgi:hypothetical protein